MGPLVVACFFFPMGRMKDKIKQRMIDHLKRVEDGALAGDDSGWMTHTAEQLKGCLCNPRFMCITLGYAAYTFTLGGVIYWCIEFVTKTHVEDDKSSAAIIMGGITATAGLLGTFVGGYLLDWYHVEDDPFNERALVTACRLLILFTISGGPCLVVATSTDSKWLCFSLLWFAQFLLLCATSVVNTAMLWSLRDPDLQSMGMALCIIIIHCLGDVPATPIMGAVQASQVSPNSDDDAIVRSWRVMFWTAEAMLGVALLFWGAAMYYAQKWVLEGTPALRSNILRPASAGDLHGMDDITLPAPGLHNVRVVHVSSDQGSLASQIQTMHGEISESSEGLR